MRERESLFNEYLIEVRRKEKEEKFQKREAVSGTSWFFSAPLLWYFMMFVVKYWIMFLKDAYNLNCSLLPQI